MGFSALFSSFVCYQSPVSYSSAICRSRWCRKRRAVPTKQNHEGRPPSGVSSAAAAAGDEDKTWLSLATLLKTSVDQ